MNETMKKLTAETRSALIASIASEAVTKLFSSIKEASDEDCGSFNVVISTADTDRQGDSVNQDGWDLSFYKNNPVVLWGHDYASLPIGVCTSIEVKDGKLTASGKFAPADANPFAQQVRRLYDLGMVRATSVGFIPSECDYSREPAQILKAELLEFSFVPVPANPHALTLDQVKKLKIDTSLLMTKGIQVTVKEEVSPTIESKPTTEEVKPESVPAPVNPEPVVSASTEEVKSIHEKLDRITVALEKHGLLEGAGEAKETEANPNRSRTSSALKELNDFVETRMLLRSIDNSIEKVLRNFNEAARSK